MAEESRGSTPSPDTGSGKDHLNLIKETLSEESTPQSTPEPPAKATNNKKNKNKKAPIVIEEVEETLVEPERIVEIKAAPPVAAVPAPTAAVPAKPSPVPEKQGKKNKKQQQQQNGELPLNHKIKSLFVFYCLC